MGEEGGGRKEGRSMLTHIGVVAAIKEAGC